MKDPQGFLEGAGQSPAACMGFVTVALIPVPRACHWECCDASGVPRLLDSFLN